MLSSAPGNTQSERQAFYARIGASHLTPLWEVLHSLVPQSPRSPCATVGWHYDEVRPYLMEAGRLIGAKEAERRVLIFENPALRGHSCLTQTLYAGLQLLLPGEVAPSHRHTQSALRLVLEGEGAYTAVDGERTVMRPGDFIITPSMTWHDHGNPGDQPVVWLDGLDIPLLRFLDAGFAEKYPDDTHPVTRPEGDANARFGGNLAPMDYTPPRVGASPIFNYPYAQTRETLTKVSRGASVDPHHGHGLRFLNPTTGAAPIPTIGACVQLLPPGFKGRPYRATDSRIFCCLEGEGRIDTDDWSFEFAARDVFTVPSWIAHRLSSPSEAVVFSFSERPVQQALGLWREERIA
ncbi:gentisate 1,2-dioxygenase [Steroidobacter sp.]|uniref:gentisate 1,2-dioxygenase n=1 Tax=Steroidobacter sp. TaxID=1978227 RepID=UPI001A44AACC|nr:gentisate 1,2-dioxygenase [Steroidobacter sp.]MBL8270042.1 gentisate 1,2-dioxygenase [Steroidobacter sp.]